MLALALTLLAAGTAADADVQAVTQLEDRLIEAQQKNDTQTLQELWADDYTFVAPNGRVFTRAQRLAQLGSGDLKYESVKVDDRTVRVYENAAVVTYRSTIAAEKSGKDISSSRRVTATLVKRAGKWQIVSQTTTVILGG